MEKNPQLNKNYANSKLNKLLLLLQIIVGCILSVTRALCEKKTLFTFVSLCGTKKPTKKSLNLSDFK